MAYFKGVEILDQKIKQKVTTANIYKVFNKFIRPMLSKEEFTYLEEIEKFMLEEIEPRLDYAKDVYELFPILGKGNYMQ